jgi:hypothetical protein
MPLSTRRNKQILQELLEKSVMTNAKRFVPGGMFGVGLLTLVCWFSISSAPSQAQTYSGDNVVYSASSQNSETNSHAFIDASQLGGSDICAKINTALFQLANHPSAYGAAAVIDARGINPSGSPCSTSPWTGTTAPATVLLPAGTIVIPNKWVLPNYTRLVGEGDNIGSGTIIQANSSFPDSDMIDLGNSIVCPVSGGLPTCNSVSVENLILDAQGKAINGIVNTNAQTGSYVDHVSLFRILGTGLQVSGNAQNSGPYTNITFNTGLLVGSSSTACAQVVGLSSTKGIHGLTCISSPDSPHAVLLDSSNNTLEDTRIVGFYDGILVGSETTAQGNVLLNVVGDTFYPGNIPAPINVIHVAPNNQVTDLSIVGVNNQGAGNTIWDEPTSTTLADSHVAIYVLGRQAAGASGYSRFTTSPNAATWVVGTSAPAGTACTSSAGGSLFSNTIGTPKALYFCPVGGGTWIGIQ